MGCRIGMEHAAGRKKIILADYVFSLEKSDCLQKYSSKGKSKLCADPDFFHAIFLREIFSGSFMQLTISTLLC